MNIVVQHKIDFKHFFSLLHIQEVKRDPMDRLSGMFFQLFGQACSYVSYIAENI